MENLIKINPGAIFGKTWYSLDTLIEKQQQCLLEVHPDHNVSVLYGEDELGMLFFTWNHHRTSRPTIRVIVKGLFELIFDVREYSTYIQLHIHLDRGYEVDEY